MSPRPPGPGEQAVNRQQLLQVLAERLDNDLLHRLFPETPPETVRRLLREAATQPGDVPAGERLPASAASGADQLLLYCDGASRGNPGLAGAGVVLYDQRGREICARHQFLGTCTNNMAEYQALLLGLGEALRQGARELAIHLDSELLVRQLTGRYRVRDAKLKPLYAKAKEMLARFDKVTVKHVPRGQNQRADQLANQAIDQRC